MQRAMDVLRQGRQPSADFARAAPCDHQLETTKRTVFARCFERLNRIESKVR